MMQMTLPMAMAPTMPSAPAVPVALSIVVAISSVAMAIPETGLLEEPIMPTIREDTVAKKKPNTRMVKAPTELTGIPGNSHITRVRARQATSTTFTGTSCSVRRVPTAPTLP